LGEFREEEKKVIKASLDRAIEMIKSYGTIGITRTMNFFNK
jgi:PTH1 family peptidyl-tRNA hydrolase